MAEIVLDRVSKVYRGGVKGVNDLSLEVGDPRPIRRLTGRVSGQPATWR